jgi:hypothetical protein
LKVFEILLLMPRRKKKALKKSPSRVWIGLAVLLLIFVVFLAKGSGPKIGSYKQSAGNSGVFDIGNQTIILNNEEISFYNGLHKSLNGSYSQHSVSIGRKEVSPDGTRFASIIEDSPGGLGTFYYVIGGMLVDGKAFYSKPVLLGDRIKIESLEVSSPDKKHNGVIKVKYLDRAAGEPMASEPTIEVLNKFGFDSSGNLVNLLY